MSDRRTVRSPACARLFVSLREEAAAVRIEGRANARTSAPFRKAVEELREKGARSMLLFLEECSLMDSTFLGVLARLGADSSKDSGGLRISLILPTPHVLDTLGNLGVIGHFEIRDRKPDIPFQFEEISGSEDYDHCEMLRSSLEAHRALVALNPGNRARFEGVTSLLSRDLSRYRRKKESPGR